MRLHTGHTVRTDFFLVDQNDHRRLFRRFFEIQQRRCRRIRAHAVIVAIGADKRAVKADIRGLERRHAGQLCGQEILLRDTVFLVKELHHPQLDFI